ncbi:PREDICTED: protein FAR-RED-ELONGATED HYPOCOTYL 1-LIKE-like isoform X1 [Camelina sativa]|uniref:Protein FAR-RED-ELONGATED HYPOCOTYL 1-LIKE-like isoform X1 n=2 Tax=Camelina sativa TaxID=90675 RepID=A0ABM0V7B1_CAMSA|nr:PREDICTED: protein FAR-RED-ELONGATED HYPOCOTYL 1-LIKE-like isoform X1 [Camelina sativa]
MDDADECCSPSLDHSDINDPMVVAVESLDSSKKRKLRAEESDLLPLPKHFCQEQQASLIDSSCQSSDIEYAECSYGTEDTKTSEEASSSASFTSPSLYMFKDSVCSTGSSSSGYATSSIEQSSCSKVDHKTQEDADEDFTLMEFICPDSDLAVEDDLQEVLNPVGSYILSSARWSVGNQDSEEATTKPTIDQEFEQYFSTLMM